MAPSPWPDYQCPEPKAPDKHSDNNVPSSSPNESSLQSTPNSVKETGGDGIEDPQIELMAQLKPQLTALDERGLKALLDEAMSFRFPEDVEGKSVLFKGLLEEVNLKAARTTVTSVIPKQNSTSGKSSKKHKVRRNHTEDQALNVRYKTDQKYPSRPEKSKTSDLDDYPSKDSKRSSSLHDNSKSLTDPNSNESEKSGSCDAEDCNKRKKCTKGDGCLKKSDASVAKISLTASLGYYKHQSGELSDLKLRLLKRPNSEKVSSTLATKERTQNLDNRIEVEENKISDIEDKNISSLIGEYSVNDCLLKKIAAVGKKIDENGNAVNNKMDDLKKGKPRKVKMKNKNTIMSHNIEGFRGDGDLDDVLSYILSNNESDDKSEKLSGLNCSKQNRVASKVKHLSRDESSETVPRKGKKNKDSKFLKSNSLEEVSTSKLEDLTCDGPSKQSSDSDRNLSINCGMKVKEPEPQNYSYELLTSTSAIKLDDKSKSQEFKKDSRLDLESSGDLEFHIVTKKHRKKKRYLNAQESSRNMKNSSSSGKMNSFNESNQGRKDLCKNPRCHGESRGRKPASSVPPSDKSADSSDADSVHSLPVSSSSTIHLNSPNDRISLTSYADIARCVASPPRGGSTPTLNKSSCSSGPSSLGKAQCVSSEEIPCVTLPIPKNRRKNPSSLIVNIDKEYPPLKRLDSKKPPSDMFVEYTVQLPKSNDVTDCKEMTVKETINLKLLPENKSVSESTTLSVTIDSSSKRPPVILMDEKASEAGGVDELIFGFEVNQQLLIGGSGEVCNSPAEKTEDKAVEEPARSMPESDDKEDTSAALLPKEIIPPNYNYFDVVIYISSEWSNTLEELKKDENKVRYYQ